LDYVPDELGLAEQLNQLSDNDDNDDNDEETSDGDNLELLQQVRPIGVAKLNTSCLLAWFRFRNVIVLS
jgi:hypothetical protein